MDGLVIHIGWEYFLGIMFGLIGVAWYSSGRFTALENSMMWVKETLSELKVNADNSRTPVFAAHSPINLNETGDKWLIESGLKKYIDDHKTEFIKLCPERTNPYEVQKCIFQFFDMYKFEQSYDGKLKQFVFQKGTTMAVIRRVGAIYLRNLCLDTFNMNKDDIDKHDPEKT